MRYLFLLGWVGITALVSLKDWFKGLCIALPMLVFLERRDTPRGIFGIEGLNFFNVMLLFVLIGFLIQRSREVHNHQLPQIYRVLLALYLIFLFTAVGRLLFHIEALVPFYLLRHLPIPTDLSIIKDDIINALKWLVPGVLIYLGTNSSERVKMCMASILISGLLLSLQVISRMFPALIGADDMAERALRVLDNTIGYHRTDIGGILTGAAWSALAFRNVYESKSSKLFCLATFALCSLALMLTGSRAGYGAWVACAGTLTFLRWRKLMFLGPPVLILALLSIPGVLDRMEEGFTADTQSHYSEKENAINTIDSSGRDVYQITSGRVLIWGIVIKEIAKAPFLGYGKSAFVTQQLFEKTQEEGGGDRLIVNHSHNAFLDIFLESGVFALFAVCLFYFLILRSAVKVFANKASGPLEVAASGFLISFTLGQLVAYTGQGTLYPHQVSTFMYCCIGMFLRCTNSQEGQFKEVLICPEIEATPEVQSTSATPLWLRR